jgi:hypothetical protein
MVLARMLRSFSNFCCWKIRPRLRRRKGMPALPSLPMSWPLTSTEPELGRSIAAIIFSRVDLPAPDGPAR